MSMRDVMRRLIPPGSFVLFLFFLVGIWLTISPFVMTTQPSGSHWIASTVNSVTIGAILMVVSLLGILGYLFLAIRDVIRDTQARQAAEQQLSHVAE